MSWTVETISAKKQSVPRRRWGIAWLLGLGVLVNYFDRVNLSVSQDALHATFGISAVMFGYLSSAYSWTYAALQLPSALLYPPGLRASLLRDSCWESVKPPPFRLTPKPSGIGFRVWNEAWRRPSLMLPQNLPLPLACP